MIGLVFFFALFSEVSGGQFLDMLSFCIVPLQDRHDMMKDQSKVAIFILWPFKVDVFIYATASTA